MARIVRLESQPPERVAAGAASVALHVALFLTIIYMGGRNEGVGRTETPVVQLVAFQSVEPRRREGAEQGAWTLAALTSPQVAPLDPHDVRAPSLPLDQDELTAEADAPMRSDVVVPVDPVSLTPIDLPVTVAIPKAEASALLQHIERLALRTLEAEPRAQATWTDQGRRYDAQVELQRASDGVQLDRVVAEVSAEDLGRRYRTKVILKRVAFSQFTQVIDRWDPRVQLHDDEIVGRMHVNTRFNVLADAEARPALVGKVSTSANSVNVVESRSRRREDDVFREGLQIGAGRITLAQRIDPLDSAQRDGNARVRRFEQDARIRFTADGGYEWSDVGTDAPPRRGELADKAVYLVAERGVTLYVRGVVSGKVLVYSPFRIVVEDDLTYAHDPRVDPDSGDFLGLVCEKNIELAAPDVTGPGDLEIQGAMFAKRLFVIEQFYRKPSATLRIYGSLAAGSMTASEPRYATSVIYDPRFEQRRPPGFPTVDQFATDDWDGRWTEVTQQSLAGAL